MKKYVTMMAFAASMVSASAMAEGFGGSVGVTSDNIFRGVSANNERAAALGDVNYAIGNFTVGATAANFDNTGKDVELTAYANYRMPVGSAMSVDVGGIHYNYPGDSVSNTNELNLAGNAMFGDLGVQVKTSYSNDYFGSGKDNWYTEVNGTYALPMGLSAIAHYGRNDGDSAVDGMTDYKIGLGKSFGAISTEVAYVDTNRSGALTDSRWVATAKYNF